MKLLSFRAQGFQQVWPIVASEFGLAGPEGVRAQSFAAPALVPPWAAAPFFFFLVAFLAATYTLLYMGALQMASWLPGHHLEGC